MRAFGLKTQRQVFSLKNPFDGGRRVTAANLTATIGSAHAETPRLILIAHLDTKAARDAAEARALRWDWRRSASPGADDNGSGSAALIEVARVLSRLEHQPLAAIDLVWTGGEELSSIGDGGWMVNLGAEHLAHRYAAAGTPVVGAISVDMLLRERPWGPSLRIYSDGRWGSQLLAGALEDARRMFAPGVESVTRVAPGFTYSDHGSFWEQGWPGVLIIEDDFHHERYHRESDRFDPQDDFYSLRQLELATRIITGATVLLAY